MFVTFCSFYKRDALFVGCLEHGWLYFFAVLCCLNFFAMFSLPVVLCHTVIRYVYRCFFMSVEQSSVEDNQHGIPCEFGEIHFVYASTFQGKLVCQDVINATHASILSLRFCFHSAHKVYDSTLSLIYK